MQANESPMLAAPETVETIAAPIRTGPAGHFAPRFAWLVAWGVKGTLALADQALFAGAQFALNVLLARWLAPVEYGAFAVAYSIFLLVSAVHSSLLIEPMLIFGSGRYKETRRSYLAIVLRGHWLLTILASAVLLAAGLLVGRFSSQSVGYALCALSVALPFILLAWLTRRAFYIESQPGRAATGGRCSSAVSWFSLADSGQRTYSRQQPPSWPWA